MQDGIMLALTLDGEKITEYPEVTNYQVKTTCENGKGKWLVDEWKLAVEEVTGNVVCNIEFTSNPTSLKSEVESKANTNTNGYRYSGKQPDNWVWFNNEMWRIIGSIPVSQSDGTEINLVKIIRANSIGELIYDINDNYIYWNTSELDTILNSYYYGKLDLTGERPCLGSSTNTYALCNYEEIGISSEATDYYGKMVKSVNWNISSVNSSGDTISTAFTQEKKTKASRKIGLMSASDYGYASGQTAAKLVDLDDYEQNNWLYIQPEAILNPFKTADVWYITEYGRLAYNGSATSGRAVRPVVYLDPSVYIISGDGTEGNPYQIGM